jgi:hypothetical protein
MHTNKQALFDELYQKRSLQKFEWLPHVLGGRAGSPKKSFATRKVEPNLLSLCFEREIRPTPWSLVSKYSFQLLNFI